MPDHPSGTDPLTDQALDWVLLLRSGRATTADADALRVWRQQSPEHDAAFKAAARLWRDLGTMAQMLEVQERDIQERDVQQPGNPKSKFEELATGRQITPLRSHIALGASRLMSRRALIGGAVAASAVTYAVFHPPLGLWPSLEELSADYRTRKGEQRDVMLGGDVKLKLNTQTSVAVRSMQRGPEIELISGEAAVTAARPASSPLVVIAANGRLTATQASFDARCIDSVVLATCITGSLTVEQGAHKIELRQGEQISYSLAMAPGAPVLTNPAQTTAWQEGLLIFHDRPLTEVIEEVNRYRPGKIIIMNSRLGQRMVNGSFHLERLDDVIGEVRQLFDARVQRLPGGIVLLS
jgi:transmembrane sensor